jgi:hypothetical protein
MQKKNIIINFTLIIVIALLTSVFAFANADVTVDEREVLFQTSINELTRIIGSEQIEELRAVYENIYTDIDKAEASFRDSIISIQMQASANNFTDDQIRAMFAGYIETTRNALTVDSMEWSDVPTVSTPGIPVTVELNGQELTFDQPAIIVNERVLVPVRVLFEAIGADVEWNQLTQTVTATKGETVVIIQINNPIIIVNGVNVEVDVMPQIINNRTLIPVRAAAEAFGADVEWVNRRNIVRISTP